MPQSGMKMSGTCWDTIEVVPSSILSSWELETGALDCGGTPMLRVLQLSLKMGLRVYFGSDCTNTKSFTASYVAEKQKALQIKRRSP